jgi:hypothetical protein
MEAFVVVVLAVAVLGIGLIALLVLRRMRRTMDPADSRTDPQER